MKVDRTGTFLATEIDRAFSSTAKQGLPQLVIKMQLVHYFDNNEGDNGEWVDFSGYDVEATGYFVLIFNGKGGPETSLSYDQLMKVYGWDGRDFQVLTEMPAPDMFMVRIEDNDPEFADKNPFTVNWIDSKDADPHGGLKKLDAAGVANLQSQFGALLNKAGKVTPPASAKKAPPKAPPKAAPVSIDKKAAKKAKSERIAKANAKEEVKKQAVKKTPPTPPPAAPTLPAAPTTPAEAVDVSSETKTKSEAYEFVFEMQAKGTTDDQRNDAWNAAIEQVAGPIDPESKTPHAHITGEQWYQIMHETLNVVGAV